MSTHKAIAVSRGCGERQAGGLYLECGLGPGGRPVEDFLMDPPQVVDDKALGLTPIGVKLIQEPGGETWHVFDWIGAKHYPNVADFVEEVRRFGVSRRISQSIDFAKLTEDSRMILLHSRAHLENAADYFKARAKHAPGRDPWDGAWECVCGRVDHDRGRKPPPTGMCASLWYEDVTGGDPVQAMAGTEPRLVVRSMPSFQYDAMSPPEAVKPKHALAIFASFPITRIVAVKDRDGGRHEPAAQKARASKIPVELEDH